MQKFIGRIVEHLINRYKRKIFEVKMTKHTQNRIAVIGLPGSGKSTFAIQLANILHLPVHHLDKHMFERRTKSFYIFLLAIIILSVGCSKLPPPSDYYVSSTLSNKIGSQAEWRRGYCLDEEARCFILSILENELSADTAVQVAFLNNPKVQATFEELGVARADLIEAGLLSNPSFELEIRYPHTKRLKTNIEYILTTSLLDLFLLPLRTRLSKTEFEQTKVRVTNELLNLAFEVRETYFELIAERKKVEYVLSTVDLLSIQSELLSKQLAVGNVNRLEFQIARSHFLEVELQLSRSQVEIIRLQEKFFRLLGLSNETCLHLPKSLPEVEYYGFDLCTLEKIALNERLDIQVAKYEIMRICQMLGLKDWWTYTNFNAGIAGEREPDGSHLIGPGFSGEIPIFNYGQAARMRLYAQLRQAHDQLAELEIQVLSEVREAHKLLMTYLNMIDDYQGKILPMQEVISSGSEELYNVMGLGIEKLLEYKRQQILANQNFTEVKKNYLVARVQLDRALGGHLFQLLPLNCVQENP